VNRSLTTTTFLSPVQELIFKVEERMLEQAEGRHPELASALEHLLGSGGKRIRTAITLLTGCMLNGDTDRLINLAAAVELLHTATLVHDDLIDGSLLRRGIPTINSQWTPAATVLTGDFIFSRAARLAAETDSVEVMKLFAETLAKIVDGEITQLFDKRKLATRDEYYSRIHAKTASMFELAAGAASILSPVPVHIVDKMRRYGYCVGMAFQIVDDVLDFTGEQETIGKPVASDLRQGLVTLPTLCYMDNNPDDPDLKALFNGHYANEEKLLRLVTSIRRSGAINSALDEASLLIKKGLEQLEDLPENQERQALIDLSLYIVNRHR
jgi:geranylgeranyl pyrophosphate synthase